MEFSKRTQYGLRALVCFADAYERGYLDARELAARERLPRKFLESILNALARASFLVSRIGARGGYRLARPPEEILLAEIIARLEGDEFFESRPPRHQAERPGEAAIRLIENRLTEAARSVLVSMTLAELAEEVSQQGRGVQMYYI